MRAEVPSAVDRFVARLQGFSATHVFNPWATCDSEHDANRDAPEIRARQLRAYLGERTTSAKWLLVAEAAGYQGAKFSGCAMTSERMLLGHCAARGIHPHHVIRIEPCRTSRKVLKPLGYNEPTATVVWGTLLGAGVDARDWVNWNAFAFHPHRPDAPLTNRTPSRAEFDTAAAHLEAFLALFPRRNVIAVGRQSAARLTVLGVPHTAVRHPSMGGAAQFRRELTALLGRHDDSRAAAR